MEVQNWLIKYWGISKKRNLNVKAISGFYVVLTGISVQPLWVKLLHDNAKTHIIFPPILHLKLKRTELELEDKALELVKDYSKNFIEYFINNGNKNKIIKKK